MSSMYMTLIRNNSCGDHDHYSLRKCFLKISQQFTEVPNCNSEELLLRYEVYILDRSLIYGNATTRMWRSMRFPYVYGPWKIRAGVAGRVGIQSWSSSMKSVSQTSMEVILQKVPLLDSKNAKKLFLRSWLRWISMYRFTDSIGEGKKCRISFMQRTSAGVAWIVNEPQLLKVCAVFFKIL